MKVLVVGGGGMLGSDVASELARRGIPFEAPDTTELDLTDPVSVARVATRIGKVDWCFNCAAYTAVDKAESDPDAAFAINATGVSYLGKACAIARLNLLHVSTDFVFDGSGNHPLTESDPVNPLGVYAKSKLEGEEVALANGAVVLRTAWLFGPNGPSFPRTMIRAWKAGKDLRVVGDQVGSPTYTGDLARVMVDVAERAIPAGLYHAAGPEAMTWHELALRAIRTYARVVEKRDLQPEITAIKTADWPTPAARPPYSVLDSSKLWDRGIKPMPRVDEALERFVKRLPSEL